MKYVYEGPYREFRGYVFCNGNAVEVTDRGTLEAITKVKGFKEYSEPEVIEEANPDACPKCGRVVTQGKYMHVKFCKGKL